jgi:hypothetical protein
VSKNGWEFENKVEYFLKTWKRNQYIENVDEK